MSLALDLIAKEKKEKTGKLDLGNCGLTELPEELFELVWLEELNVCNEYWDFDEKEWIESPNKGWKNKFSNLSNKIEQFIHLRILRINGAYGNKWTIKDISFLANLTGLQTLYLSNNPITDYSFLANLTGLQSLDLCNNQITDIRFLANLRGLQSLDLSNNQITDYSFLANLTTLQTLCLSENQIADIRFLANLRSLQSLDLSNNQITDYSFLANLTALETLDLRNNQITDNSFLANLTALETLYLSNNQITDIQPLLPLIRLGKMEVSLKIYDWRGKLNLYNNPIENPPLAVVEQGNQAIIDYFEEIEAKGKDYLFEAKILVLGESGAGKTTFSKKIQANKAALPKDEDTTKGIAIGQWSFPISREQIKACVEEELTNNKVLTAIEQKGFRANIWDFGGQEIYHGTHQFFLTHKSLYVLLADTRQQDTDFNYWLNVVEQLSGESPLIVVLNERHGHSFRIDETGLRGRFGAFFKSAFTVNLADNNYQRLRKLRSAVKNQLTNLSHIGDVLPKSWVAIRRELADILDNEKQRYISQDRFIGICKQHEITQLSKIKSLSSYFHTIGVFIHYQTDKVLKNIIFLDANWTTKTVYQLLNDETVKENNGRFTKADAIQIWKSDENALLIEELLQLLERFSIAYNIDNTENYIVPEHLPKQQPYEQWKYQKELLLFSYVFDKFMPKGLMARLIVALHHYIEDDTMIWLRGLNITKENTYAEIIETYGTENRFDIKIYGADKKALLTTISDAFDGILSRFQNLQYQKRVPCNCSVCQPIEDIRLKNFYNYAELKDRLRKRKNTVECRNDDYKEVQILPMLENVGMVKAVEESLRRERGIGMAHLPPNSGDFVGNDKTIHYHYYASNSEAPDPKAENPSDEEATTTTPAKKSKFPFWGVAVIVGIVATAYSWWITGDPKIAVGIGLVATVLTFRFNPTGRYLRIAASAIAMIIPLNFGFRFFLNYENTEQGEAFKTIFDMDEPHFIISVVLLVVAIVALVLDYLNRKR